MEKITHFFNKAKDGGPDSPVDAYFLFEIKSFLSIAILKFNKGRRENFHSHAFHAFTWFLKGDLVEEHYDGRKNVYKRSLIPKLTKRSCNHRVKANSDSWCLTIRGPWAETWTEHSETHKITLGHGRKIVKTQRVKLVLSNLPL